jgi:hypothetical protein
MLEVKTLKSAIEGLAAPAKLDDHPLVDAQFVSNYLREHPEKQDLPKGKRLGWALADLWRTRVMPVRMTPEYSQQWETFLSLEVGYFHPFRHHARFPGKTAQIGGALSDKEQVAQVIADNDSARAADLKQKIYDDFWKAILPHTEAAIPYTTVRSRLLNAMALLLQKLQEESFPTDNALGATELEAHERLLESDATQVVAPEHLPATIPTTEPVVPVPLALAAYELFLDQQWPAIVGYRPPIGRYTIGGTSQEISGMDAAQLFLEKHQAVLLSGETGIGKTTYLTQIVIPACRRLGLTSVFVALPAYFNTRVKVDDLPSFVREKVFGQLHPDLADKEAFAGELAKAIRERRVIWLLDGYDELTPRERGLLNQELEHLDRFVLSTRRVSPEARRSIEATLQLTHLDRNEALEYISARYSANARSRIEAWYERQYEARSVLTSGLWLEEMAQLANDSSQVLSLTTVLDKAITRQLSTRARFQNATSADIYTLARAALRSLAFESLSARWPNGEDPHRLNRSQLIFAWRSHSSEPEAIFFEMIGSTGLLLEEGDQWRFPSDLVRDEFAAEFIQAEGLILSGRALYPQYERPIGFWAARLMRARQSQRVVDLLIALRDLDDDPYSARWSLIVRILMECLPYENDRLRTVQLETEQALLDWWRTTSSNKMKWQINMWLFALGSRQIPEMSSGVLEMALRNLDSAQPGYTLPKLMQQTGYADLARRLTEGSRVDQQAITHALIDIIAAGPDGLVNEAAVQLAPRNLEPTTLERLSKDSPIDRLAELARTHPMNQHVTPQDFNRARAAQSAALGILGRPIVLTNEMLLKRISADVIHSLMADLHLRIRKADNRITVITADGRDWVLKSA